MSSLLMFATILTMLATIIFAVLFGGTAEIKTRTDLEYGLKAQRLVRIGLSLLFFLIATLLLAFFAGRLSV